MNMRNVIGIFLCALTVLVAGGCDRLYIEEEVHYTPVITDFEPKKGLIGTEVTIMGEHLKDVTSVKVGGIDAAVTRVNSNLMYAKVAGGSLTGPIELGSPYGSAVSEEVFTVQYFVPEIVEYPESAELNEQVRILGSHLDMVQRVFLGTKEVEIISRTESMIEMKIPYFKADGAVDIILKYLSGEDWKELVERECFTLDISYPEFELPEKITYLSTFDIKGENMHVVENVTIAGRALEIIHADKKSLTCIMTSEFNDIPADAELVASYFGGEDRKASMVTVESPVNYIWKNIRIMAPTKNYFSVMTGLDYDKNTYSAVVNDELLFSLNSKWKAPDAYVQIQSLYNADRNGIPMKFHRFVDKDADVKAFLTDETLPQNVTNTAITLDRMLELGLQTSGEKTVIRYKFNDDNYNATHQEGTTPGQLTAVILKNSTLSADTPNNVNIGIGFIELVSVDGDNSQSGVTDAIFTVNIYFPLDIADSFSQIVR